MQRLNFPMKRSHINQLIRSASACFREHGWTLPPHPQWDVTDFGLGNPELFGLVLVNLAAEPEYCEKLMYAKKGMTTPAHCHRRKKEDIICRWGTLRVQLWAGAPSAAEQRVLTLSVNNEPRSVSSGETIVLHSGERVRLTQGVYHEFFPESDECIIGEVSTANDDRNDNCFVNPEVGRYPGIEEDEAALVHLVSEETKP
jgi:D-lyxose ketol-isomerase